MPPRDPIVAGIRRKEHDSIIRTVRPAFSRRRFHGEAMLLAVAIAALPMTSAHPRRSQAPAPVNPGARFWSVPNPHRAATMQRAAARMSLRVEPPPAKKTPASPPEPQPAPSFGAAEPARAPAPEPTVPPQVGVYLTATSVKDGDFLERVTSAVLEAGGNAVVFDVKGSYVYFDTTSALAAEHEMITPLYDLPAIVRHLEEKGLSTIARFIAVKDPVFTERVPQTLLRSPKTGARLSPGWVDPMNETALEYNRQILRDVAASGVDEINLDYIRFSTEYPQSLSVYSGQEKADRVEAFVRMARETIDEVDSGVKLGLSTYAILGWNYPVNLETLGQDFVRFAPLVDVISPMAYPATFSAGAYYDPARHPRSRMYYLVYRTITGYRELLGDEHAWKIRPWIQGYGVTTQNMRDQMDAVFDAGACGFTVWSASNSYFPFYNAMEGWERPARCG